MCCDALFLDTQGQLPYIPPTKKEVLINFSNHAQGVFFAFRRAHECEGAEFFAIGIPRHDHSVMRLPHLAVIGVQHFQVDPQAPSPLWKGRSKNGEGGGLKV